MVGGSWDRRDYTLTPVGGGTQVAGSREFLPGGITRFHNRYDDTAEAERRGIPVSLAAIEQAAEAG